MHIHFGWNIGCCDIVLWESTIKYYKLRGSQFPAVMHMEYHILEKLRKRDKSANSRLDF